MEREEPQNSSASAVMDMLDAGALAAHLKTQHFTIGSRKKLIAGTPFGDDFIDAIARYVSGEQPLEVGLGKSGHSIRDAQALAKTMEANIRAYLDDNNLPSDGLPDLATEVRSSLLREGYRHKPNIEEMAATAREWRNIVVEREGGPGYYR